MATGRGRTRRVVAIVTLAVAWILASAPVASAGDASGINVTLPVGGKYTGRIVDKATGVGLAGVTVSVWPTDGLAVSSDRFTTKTSATGAWSIVGLFRNVTYDVSIWPNDDRHVSGCWSGNTTHFVLSCGAATPAPAPATAGTSLGTSKLPVGHTFSGTVRGGTVASNVVVPGVSVAVRGYTNDVYEFRTTAADGSWSLGGLPAGDYRITFDSPPTRNYRDGGYKPNASGTNWSTGYSLVPLSADATADVILPTGRTVTGYVRTSAGLPVVGASVAVGLDYELDYYGNEVKTDANGRFVFRGLSSGTGYLVRVQRPEGKNYMDGYYRSGVASNFTYRQDLATPISVGTSNVTLPDIKPFVGYTIIGTVLLPNDSPAKDAFASAEGGPTYAWAFTNASGVFTLMGLTPGTYSAYIGSPTQGTIGGWFDSATPTYKLTLDQAAADKKQLSSTSRSWNIGTVKLKTFAGHAISGTIKGGTVLLAGASVQGLDWNVFARGSATTAADGTYRMTGLRPASYVLTIQPPAGKNYVAGYYRSGVTGNWTRDESRATRVAVGP